MRRSCVMCSHRLFCRSQTGCFSIILEKLGGFNQGWGLLMRLLSVALTFLVFALPCSGHACRRRYFFCSAKKSTKKKAAQEKLAFLLKISSFHFTLQATKTHLLPTAVGMRVFRRLFFDLAATITHLLPAGKPDEKANSVQRGQTTFSRGHKP